MEVQPISKCKKAFAITPSQNSQSKSQKRMLQFGSQRDELRDNTKRPLFEGGFFVLLKWCCYLSGVITSDNDKLSEVFGI